MSVPYQLFNSALTMKPSVFDLQQIT